MIRVNRSIIKVLLFISVFGFVNSNVKAQDIKYLKKTKNLVWFGLDFSKTKLIGTEGSFSDIEKISNYYFSEWNSLFLVEYKKYDLEYNYRSSKVFNDINIAVQNSLKNDVSTILTLKNNEITKQQISDIVETYSTEHDSKTGLVYIVEKLDKLNSEVVVWVTFFDIGSQKVLLTKRVIGSVGGFGFRNYWMRGFYEVFKYSGRKLHKWVKE